MTQQYLVGELSLLLAALQDAAGGGEPGRAAGTLRQEAETRPWWALAGVELRALALVESLCWASLHRGDVVAFDRQARLAGRLREFGLCSGLLPRRSAVE